MALQLALVALDSQFRRFAITERLKPFFCNLYGRINDCQALVGRIVLKVLHYTDLHPY